MFNIKIKLDKTKKLSTLAYFYTINKYKCQAFLLKNNILFFFESSVVFSQFETVLIELDDYTHNYNNRIKRDNYINTLFESNNLKLLRIKVKNTYNMDELEEKIKQLI